MISQLLTRPAVFPGDGGTAAMRSEVGRRCGMACNWRSRLGFRSLICTLPTDKRELPAAAMVLKLNGIDSACCIDRVFGMPPTRLIWHHVHGRLTAVHTED